MRLLALSVVTPLDILSKKLLSGNSPNATSVEPVAPRSPELATAGLLTSTYATLDVGSRRSSISQPPVF